MIKTGRPKKYKKEQVRRMVQLLEAGLETTVPDVPNKNDTARATAAQKFSGVEIFDADGCCVLCGGAAADLFCTFPCPSTTSKADAEDVVSVCGCM